LPEWQGEWEIQSKEKLMTDKDKRERRILVGGITHGVIAYALGAGRKLRD